MGINFYVTNRHVVVHEPGPVLKAGNGHLLSGQCAGAQDVESGVREFGDVDSALRVLNVTVLSPVRV